MSAHRLSDDAPASFTRAVESIRAVTFRPEISVDEAPAPVRLAPYALALEAEVGDDDNDLGHGRLVILHDPQGQDAWNGTFRIVLFVKATLETEMAADDMLTSVGWSWLEEALEEHSARAGEISATVTRTTSESFGVIGERPIEGQIEIRASWTAMPGDPGDLRAVDLGSHVRVWEALLAQAAGLPPIAPGITVLPRQRRS